MFKNEKEYQTKLVNYLNSLPGWAAQSHDDKFRRYVPDVSYSAHGYDGWIEVKYVIKPINTIGDIHHFTFGQENWLKRVGDKGCGQSFLLIGFPDVHALWHWSVLGTELRKRPIDDAFNYAVLASSSLDSLVGLLDRRLSTNKS